MSAMIPMAVYGLEVPAGDLPIPATTEIPSAFRITMAAIDPTAEPEGEDDAIPRATLKILRVPLDEDSDEDDDDEEDFDIEDFDREFGEAADDDDDDDDEDSEDEDANGGPSDPAKSKKARKQALEKQIQALMADEHSEMDTDDLPNGVNGTLKSLKALGKMAASEDEVEDDDDEDEDAGELEEFVICTLDPAKNCQQPLDITVGEREHVFFQVTGTHSVFLTGNYVEPADAHADQGMYDPDSDEDEDYDLEPDSDELDMYDEEDELDGLDNPRVLELDAEDDGEDAPALVKKAKKSEKKGKNKRPAEDEEDGTAGGESIDDLIANEVKKDLANGEPKLSKKQLKKQKKNDGSAAATAMEEAKKGAEAPSSNKSDKKVSFAKELEQGPTPTKDGKDKPKASLGVKVIQGVTIDDKKLGTGPAAQAGDRVGMRYIGKLKDGKVFDSNKKGKPFSFKLGTGEVIKGWDIGVAGMSAGGERRITIPPHHGYGSKGTAGIPGNSTLVFDVKLLEINKSK